MGDRVGIGAQVGSCMNCNDCSHDNENYCANYMVDTYNSRWPDGSIAQGGYSTAIRAHQKFVFPIPDGIKSEHAAPMLCAGLTVYSPLYRSKVGPGSRVGVIGVVVWATLVSCLRKPWEPRFSLFPTLPLKKRTHTVWVLMSSF